jgi:competence protein ComEC
MSGAYFYASTIGFMVGVALASIGVVDGTYAVLVAIMGAASAALFFFHRDRILLALCCALVMCAIGTGWMTRVETHLDSQLSRYETREVSIVGIVTAEPDSRDRSTLLTVDVETIDGTPHAGRVMVRDNRLSDVRYGDRISVQGTLREPEPFETDLGRTFDYPGYLRAKGITHTVSFGTIEVQSSGNGSTIVSSLLLFKGHMSSAIRTALLAPESGLALGLILGEREGLGEEAEQAFRDAGLVHIIVLSGYNIALMIAAVMALLAFTTKRVRIVAGGVGIVLFVLMVGPSATVVRAAIMAILILAAQATRSRYAVSRALMVAALGMLIWNPYLLVHDPGFQLSFLATLGLIVLAPIIEDLLTPLIERISILRPVQEYLVATVATQIMVAPLLVYSIGSLSLVSIISNVVILPFVPLAMALSAAVGAVGFFSSSIALVVGYPTDLLLSSMIASAQFFARLPYASVTLPPFSFAYVLIAYAVLGIGIAYVSSWKKGSMLQSEASVTSRTSPLF